uniref:Cilia- and flagella-associated protein 299 n=1 Tax=Rhodnius prolixus TaxID=13249 RepID=R4G7Y6_RHOPR
MELDEFGTYETSDQVDCDIITVGPFSNYYHYLDSFIHPTDSTFLPDLKTGRMMVQLGYRGDILSREEFYAKKRKIKETYGPPPSAFPDTRSISVNLDLPLYQLADEFSYREKPNRMKKMLTIFFVRIKTRSGNKLTSFIDYAERLKHEDLRDVFILKKRLWPKSTDLMYHNWSKNIKLINHTENIQVMYGSCDGLLFKCKEDQCIIDPDINKNNPGRFSNISRVSAPGYDQIVIFDHIMRRKF